MKLRKKDCNTFHMKLRKACAHLKRNPENIFLQLHHVYYEKLIKFTFEYRRR